MGADFPDALVSVLCKLDAAVSRQEKSPALASTLKSLTFPDVVMTMRRLFGPCSGAAHQDKLVAEDADESQEACAA